jgi:hypothetical protein
MAGDASYSLAKESVDATGDDNDEKAVPCVAPNTHGGMRDGDGGKDSRWMGTPAETPALALAGVEKPTDGAWSVGWEIAGRGAW